MRAVLIKTPSAFDDAVRTRDLTVFPLAIYHLAGVLAGAGVDVRTIDPIEIDDTFIFGGRVGETFAGIDLVGLSVNTFNLATTRDLVRQIKREYPDLTCVVGGVHPSHYPEATLRYTGADLALLGEADETLPELCRALERGEMPRDLPGMHWITPEGTHAFSDRGSRCPDLDAVPTMPRLDQLPRDTYHMAPFETSRGCRFSCTFCSILGTRNWRGRGVGTVVDSLAAYADVVRDRVVTNGILFTDDCFTGDPVRAAAVLTAIERARLPIRLMFEARVTDLLKHPDLMDRMVASRPYGVEMGIECGYDEGLKRIRKGLTTRHVCECLDALRDRELTRSVRLSFIIGLPFETAADIERTLAFAAYCMETYDCTTSVAWWIPAPSPLWSTLREHGIVADESHFYEKQYERNPVLFRHYHANVSAAEIQRIGDLLRLYYSMGLSLLDIRTLPVNRPVRWSEVEDPRGR